MIKTRYILLLTCFLFQLDGFTQASKNKNWKLAIQTWTFHKYSFLVSVEKADSLGVKFLEVYPGQKVGAPYNSSFTFTLAPKSRMKLKQHLNKKGIQVIALGVIDNEYYTKENLESYFEFAQSMGIPFITAEPERNDLDEFNRLAEKYNVRVGIHCHPKPHSHYWHPDSMVSAMKGRSHIGAWPDIGHWARNGVQIIESLKKMEGKLWGIHLKDVKEFNKISTKDTILGSGICQIPEVVKELKRQKFSGIVSMEYEVHENDNMGDMKMNKKYWEGIINDEW